MMNTESEICENRIESLKLNEWYCGRDVTLKIPMPGQCIQGCKLKFKVRLYKPGFLSKRGLNIRINGALIRTVFAYSKGYLLVEIDLKENSFGDEVELRFDTDSIYSPKESEGLKDQRNLFLFFAGISLKPYVYGVVTPDDCLRVGKVLAKDLFSGSLKSPWDEAPFLMAIIKNAIVKREPFSMVRFGDGEGRILGYPNVFNLNEIKSEVLRYQFGKTVFDSIKKEYSGDSIDNAIEDLKLMLIDSMCSADIVGLPSWLHFKSDVTSKNRNGLLGQASALITFTENTCLSTVRVFDHFIFRKFHYDGLFVEILTGLDFLGLISHTNISDKLKHKFSIEHVEHYKIPGHQSFMKTGSNHFPDVYKEIINEISVPYRGAVFFVAAGYLGKVYCTAIKQKGGIAIDIGSIFDGWIGLGRKNVAQNKDLRL